MPEPFIFALKTVCKLKELTSGNDPSLTISFEIHEIYTVSMENSYVVHVVYQIIQVALKSF